MLLFLRNVGPLQRLIEMVSIQMEEEQEQEQELIKEIIKRKIRVIRR